MPAEHAFGGSRRAAAHQQDGRVVSGQRDPDRPLSGVARDERRPVMVAGRERDAIAVLFLAEESEQQPEQRRKVLLDVGGNDAPDCRARLDPLDPLIEARQRDDGLDAVLSQRRLELMLRVGRIQRGDDGADLPRRELGDEELRAVGQQQRDAIAAPDAQRRQGRCERVAQSFERGAAEGRPLEEQRGGIGPFAG